jgi:DNA polymerase I-like protein with 3'-5' exonuclease and polymerase domains
VKASRFFLSAATSALAVASDVGIRTNPDLMEQSSRELEMQIAALASEIQEIPAIKEHFPHQFRPGNNNEIAALLYDKIKIPPSPKLGKDKTGRSVTKDHLETMDLPFIDTLINYRRLTKMRDYFGQFRREAVDGTIRASFNLSSGGASTGGSDAGGGPKTFRGSVQNPSLQNVPKRQKDMAKLLRQGFVPRPGNRFGEADYKAVEVAIGACVHKDPMMIKYVTDPSTDMHRDVGMQIFFRGESELSKDERQAAKNGFVFPSFYGSSFENTHRGIWKQTPQATKDHLVKNGIRNINDFKGHIEAIEKDFWKRRFAAYDAWKDETWRFYKRHGFVELPTGFRCFGPMKRTEVINIPIQGPAYHCLLWYKTQVTPLIHGISGRSDVILNIHDSLVTDHHPDDQEEMHRIIWEWGTQRIREHWPWIIVPLTIEAEVSDTDGSWAKLNNVGALDFSKK